jgi:hypothetical protein
MINNRDYNKDRKWILVRWLGQKDDFCCTNRSFHIWEVEEVRLPVCKVCKSELYLAQPPFVILMHPDTGTCSRWEHGYKELYENQMYYIMGPVQMSDLEPYAYKWRFIR